jgi:cytochrome c-type protein NapB
MEGKMGKPWIGPALAAIAFAGLGMVSLGLAAAQSDGIKSLRGPTAIPDTSPPPPRESQETETGLLPRAYRQQPPLIPHSIEGYQIDLKENQCLMCHDWPNNTDVNAPLVSQTHYIGRDGIALDHVARNRWFCTQCHVPQENAPALVGNKFKSSVEVE